MTEFASTRNSPAEERAILAEIISTFDAVELKPPGIERARQFADQSESLEAGQAPISRENQPAHENLPLWDAA